MALSRVLKYHICDTIYGATIRMKQEEAEKEISNALRALKEAGASFCCNDLVKLLEGLGFVVRDGKRGGHKLYHHKALANFFGSGFNCGHGKNPEIKPVYVRNVRKVIEEYKVEIQDYLERAKP